MKWPRLKLRWQLLLSYLPLVLAPVLVLGLVVHNEAERGLNVLVTQEAADRTVAVSGAVIRYYQNQGTWNGIEPLLIDLVPSLNRPDGPRFQPLGGPAQPQPGVQMQSAQLNPPGPQGQPERGPRTARPAQIIITDTQGIVVASDNIAAQGQTVAPETLANGTPLIVDGTPVGTLVVGTTIGALNTQERQLLDNLSNTLLLTGLLVSMAAIGLALWLSGQLTAPVSELMNGVKRLAAGNWSEPVPVRSHNEIADLTHAFNAMAEQLTRQQQQQRQMIADIAHDLRTPLSVLGLEVEGIRAGLQTPQEATDSLQEEIDWLQHLIDDLHTLSLMDTGQFTLYQDDVLLGLFLLELANQWQSMAARQGKTLTTDIAADLPIVRLDPFRMRQVIGNLLNNALHHTPDGTTIVLSARSARGTVEISVSDNGPGIAPEDLAHIFDRFYRADRSRNRGRREHGSGLGLSIAYQLVSLHRGRLMAASTPGAGATFSFTLPVSGQAA